MPERTDSEPQKRKDDGSLAIHKAREELRALMTRGRQDPSLVRQLRKILKTAEQKGVALTHEEFRVMMDEARTLALGHDLLRAAKDGDAYAIEKLLGAGAPVNIQDPRTGATALHYTAAYDARPAFRKLMQSGECDFLIRDNKGRRAWELANDADDFAMTRLLFYKARKQAEERGVAFRRREPRQ